MISIALGLPHAPWVPERVESFARLTHQLGLRSFETRDGAKALYPACRVFSDRESNKIWPRKMWGWGIDVGTPYFLTLQDDTLVAPYFWRALNAMIEAHPDKIIGLSAVHPMGPEMARQGHRWYRTSSWLVGWAYVLPRADLQEFLTWFDQHPERVATTNEDSLLNEWIAESGRETWHPVPSIVDHDTSIASTYANDNHLHRRTTVTWRGYSEADLISPDFWRGSGPKLGMPAQGMCWMCTERPARVVNHKTGAGICPVCVVQVVGNQFGLTMQTA